MNKLKKILIKEFDKTSYVDFKRLEKEPIDLEYLKERKEKISAQFKTMQIIATIAMIIMVAGMFYMMGSENFNQHLFRSLIGIGVFVIVLVFGQLTWNRKHTDAQKNIFIIELLEEIEKDESKEANLL